MNNLDRRRIIVAGLITVTVLALVWLFNSGASDGNESSSCTDCADSAGNSAPVTTEYEPYPPLFIGGADDSIPTRIVVVATAPPPEANQVLTTSQFFRFVVTDTDGSVPNARDASMRRCSTLLAPEGAFLTVLNVDNGQSTTCINTQGITVPSGVGMVMHTEVYAEIGDLADAPLAVRVTWTDTADE
ncbi:MAG: hypothetical protein HY826_00805 [Actinobacteria bacterium]|nr:hypothetical protein [Actinomycetota bacterium]